MVSRSISIKPVPAKDSHTILEKQRLRRPVAPHLTIYRPQVTSVLSISHRITGQILSGGIYLFFAAYAASPLLGWDLSSGSVAAAVAAWPVALTASAKGLLGFFFSFHSFNGVRHLVWDAGKAMTNGAVIRSGWAVVGLSVCSGAFFALY
ncbi:Succinate dehydrogenase cytochrome b560 subunit [Neofusicoccum parvum]|nr:Succinate dehydrogenase cytochrome b560 subunit [Neofusicoccum parvum]